MKKLREIKVEKNISLPTIEQHKEYDKLPEYALSLSKQDPNYINNSTKLKVFEILDKKIKYEMNAGYGDHGFYVRSERYDISCTDKEKLTQAYESVLLTMIPLPDKKVIEHLAVMFEVQIATGQKMPPQEKARRMSIMFRDIPADLAVTAIEYLTKHSKFWVSFAEVWKVVEPTLKQRKSLLEHIGNKIKTLQLPAK